jgi:hypothetical protein
MLILRDDKQFIVLYGVCIVLAVTLCAFNIGSYLLTIYNYNYNYFYLH